MKIKIKNNSIKLLAFDVDGVLTDGGMYYADNGNEFKKFNSKDGRGIAYLTQNNFPVIILSSCSNSNIIQRRAKKLGIKYVIIGTEDKISHLKIICKKLNINLFNVAFIGDDINDLECMKNVGFPVCPNDAVDLIKKHSKIILNKKGGEGCVREFIDKYLIEYK